MLRRVIAFSQFREISLNIQEEVIAPPRRRKLGLPRGRGRKPAGTCRKPRRRKNVSGAENPWTSGPVEARRELAPPFLSREGVRLRERHLACTVVAEALGQEGGGEGGSDGGRARRGCEGRRRRVGG
jgi:hypothetical protein